MVDSLEESIDRLAITANSIADELVAARKLNQELITALNLIGAMAMHSGCREGRCGPCLADSAIAGIKAVTA